MPQEFSANHEEWSKLYTFFSLLHSGTIIEAGANLYPSGKCEKIKKLALDTNSVYLIDSSAGKIVLENSGEELSSPLAAEVSNSIYDAIFVNKKTKDKKGAFAIAEANPILEKFGVKASEDIWLSFSDAPLKSYRVFSFIDEPPTLISASSDVKVRYDIKNCNDSVMYSANACAFFADKFFQLKAAKCSLESKQTDALSNMVLDVYSDGLFGEELSFSDEAEIAKFLRTSAKSIDGGYIFLKPNTTRPKILYIPANDHDLVERCLKKNTQFVVPEAMPPKMGKVRKSKNKYFIELPVEVVFRD